MDFAWFPLCRYTPLHYAVYERHTAASIFLIKWGADVHAADQYLKTPMHYAAEQNVPEVTLRQLCAVLLVCSLSPLAAADHLVRSGWCG